MPNANPFQLVTTARPYIAPDPLETDNLRLRNRGMADEIAQQQNGREALKRYLGDPSTANMGALIMDNPTAAQTVSAMAARERAAAEEQVKQQAAAAERKKEEQRMRGYRVVTGLSSLRPDDKDGRKAMIVSYRRSGDLEDDEDAAYFDVDGDEFKRRLDAARTQFYTPEQLNQWRDDQRAAETARVDSEYKQSQMAETKRKAEEAAALEAEKKAAKEQEAAQYQEWLLQTGKKPSALASLEFQKWKATKPDGGANKPALIEEYEYAKAQGYKGSFEDFRNKRPAGAAGAGAGSASRGKDMTQGALKDVTQLRNGLELLTGLEKAVDDNSGYMGPVVGAMGQDGILGTGAKIVGYTGPAEFNAKLKLIKQTIGKAMEGGVLRKEDEAKYEQILPSITDPPQIAKTKIQLVRQTLQADLDNYLRTQTEGGRNTSAMQPKPTPGQPKQRKPLSAFEK